MEIFVLSYANVLCIYPKFCVQASGSYQESTGKS